LSTGGILWRIAMDVCPPPEEQDLTRSFHRKGCVSHTVDGTGYWIPTLTTKEQDFIVGVYRWAICKLVHDTSCYITHLVQLPSITPRMIVGGQNL
jgi:hypothetical protein